MATATRERRKLTGEDAKTFDRYSIANASQAMATLQESGACKGRCEAYQDIFTYNRWLALGYQVRKGEHGAKLPVIISTEKEDAEGQITVNRRPWMTTVFCKCQVENKDTGMRTHTGVR
jgi:antirestriction protein ArdC